MLTNFKRILSFAFADFYRHKGISMAAILVLSITTMLVTGLYFLRGMSNALISSIEEKIDITAYFNADVSEEEIEAARQEILKDAPDIKNIQYVSKEQALEEFAARHQDDSVFLQALQEVGENPFLPSLNITTSGKPADYEKVAAVLEQEKYDSLIEKVDFYQKKDTIEKVFSVTDNINKFGLLLGGLMALVVLVVVFNTIRLVIDNSQEEIRTMRIVGASNWFIRMPFIIQGALFGLASFIACFFVTMALAYFLSPAAGTVLPGFNLFGYFIANMLMVMLIQISAGVLLGVVASFIVVSRYLKV